MNNFDKLKAQLPSIENYVEVTSRKGKEWAAPCPECGGDDRFFFTPETSKGFCRQCEKIYDTIDLERKRTGKTLPELFQEYGITSTNINNTKTTNNQENSTNKITFAWEKSIRNESKINQYFSKRNINFSDTFPLPAAIRYSEFRDKKTNETVRSIVYAVTNLQEKQVKAIQRVFVDEQMSKISRIMKGDIAKHGRGVWFHRDRAENEDKLIIGEGVETVLSAMQATGINGVAGLDSGKMLKVNIPPNIKELFILVDEDIKNPHAKKGYAGQKAAIKLAKQFEDEEHGKIAWLVTPSDSCFTNEPTKLDFNDLSVAEILDRFDKKQRVDTIEWVPPDEENKGQNDNISNYDVVINKYNAQFAACNLSGKFAILEIEEDGSVTYWNKTAFVDFHSNEKVWVETGHGKVVQKKAPLEWLESAGRRSYKGVVFDPTQKKYGDKYYNLFNGYPELPKGKCDKVLDLLLNVIANGNEEHFRYICAWFANILKKPWQKNSTALVFTSNQGCGKGLLMSYMAKIFGRYYVEAIDSSQITGRFNNLLLGKTLVYANEAFFVGDKKHNNILKALITEPTMIIEEKNISSYQVDSFVNLVISFNDSHGVTVEHSDRRFAVFALNEEHRRDKEYFDPIIHELNNGGPGALAEYLLSQDYSDIDIRKIPDTEERNAQKAMSLNIVQEFWLDVLTKGFIFSPDNRDMETAYSIIYKDNLDSKGEYYDVEDMVWPTGVKIRPSFLYDAFLSYCRENNKKIYGVSFLSFLRISFGSSGRTIRGQVFDKCYIKKKSKSRYYCFYDLDWARNDFKRMICDVDFPEVCQTDDPPF